MHTQRLRPMVHAGPLQSCPKKKKMQDEDEKKKMQREDFFFYANRHQYKFSLSPSIDPAGAHSFHYQGAQQLHKNWDSLPFFVVDICWEGAVVVKSRYKISTLPNLVLPEEIQQNLTSSISFVVLNLGSRQPWSAPPLLLEDPNAPSWKSKF